MRVIQSLEERTRPRVDRVHEMSMHGHSVAGVDATSHGFQYDCACCTFIAGRASDRRAELSSTIAALTTIVRWGLA